jgi:hypothetical protein
MRKAVADPEPNAVVVVQNRKRACGVKRDAPPDQLIVPRSLKQSQPDRLLATIVFWSVVVPLLNNE